MFSRVPRLVRAQRGNHRYFAARTLWRWGNTEAEVPEVSRTPQVVPEGADVTAIACGATHSAFVVDGQLYTFGSNRYGKLGRDADADGGTGTGVVGVEASDGHRPAVASIALGGNHSAAITEGGVLWTWGYGGSLWSGAGGCGLGRRGEMKRPEMVMPFVTQGVEVVQVACGDLHSIALDREGRVHSTGSGLHGALGRGGLASTGEELDFQEVVYFRKTTDSILAPGVEPQIVKLDAGREFSAAMSSHGELWVWGRNDYGQLAMGFEVMKDRDVCMKYPFLMRHLPMEGHVFRDFACGDRHIVAVTTAGAIYEWGDRRTFEPTAVTLPSRYQEGLKGVWKVAAGESCSFALTLTGELYSWGRRSSGCLADMEMTPMDDLVNRPRQVAPEIFQHQRVVDIAVSKQRCLAITEE